MAYKDKQQMYRYQIQRWRDRKKKAVEHLGGKCQRCDIIGHYSIYDFHHVDPEQKDFIWTKLRLRNWDDILTELSKCLLLCANCHRLEHWELY